MSNPVKRMVLETHVVRTLVEVSFKIILIIILIVIVVNNDNNHNHNHNNLVYLPASSCAVIG